MSTSARFCSTPWICAASPSATAPTGPAGRRRPSCRLPTIPAAGSSTSKSCRRRCRWCRPPCISWCSTAPGRAPEDLRRHPRGRHLRRVQPPLPGWPTAGADHRRGMLVALAKEVLRARRHRGQQATGQERAADLAARAGGGEADRPAVRHRARDQRQVDRGTSRDTPGAECTGAGRSQGLDAGRTREAVASFLRGQGHGLYAPALGDVRPLPRRRPHLPHE